MHGVPVWKLLLGPSRWTARTSDFLLTITAGFNEEVQTLLF